MNHLPLFGGVMPAVSSHSTATVDVPWDAGMQEKKLKEPVGKTGLKMYAWYDPKSPDTDGDDGYPDAKSGWKFPHHMVAADGAPGAANMAACRNGLARLSGANIPAADRAGVQAHLDRHLKDGGGTPAKSGAWRL